jgi:EmrB/QacA subfamily drug resistance transporter
MDMEVLVASERDTDRRRRLVTVACMLSVFMVAVEVTIVGTAMPTIVGQLGRFDLFTWVFAAYILTSAVTGPVYGRLADLYGRKPVYYFGAILFLAGSAMCGFATDMLWLIAFRTVQGLGAGALQPLIITILGDVHKAEARARVLAWQSSVWGVAAIIGPAAGAFIVEYLRWEIVFWLNIPIGLVALGMLAYAFKESPERRQHSVDYLGSILLMFGAGAILMAGIQAQDLSRTLLVTLAASGVVALVWLYFHERSAPEPIVPFHLWRARSVSVSNIGAAFIGMVLSCTTLFLPTYVQGVMGYSPTIAGAVFAMQSLAWSSGGIVITYVMARANFMTTAAIGGLFLIAGCIVFVLADRGSSVWWVTSGATLVGLGMGACNTTFIVACQNGIGWSDRGGAVSGNIFMRTIGMAIGAGVGGALVNYSLAHLAPGMGDTVRKILDPVLRNTLASSAVAEVADAIGAALHDVYLFSVLAAVAAFACAFLLPAHLRLKPKE